MCGITGFFNPFAQTSSEQMQVTVQAMSSTLIHRGPDDGGCWINAEMGIALGHRRLAILDLSPEGHQPMVSADDRYVIVFNGEIYNFLELRDELKRLGHQFRGHSDTEVMLASFSQWGLHKAIARFNGMFAFALWDQQARTLHLGRDRLGEKPLYYGWVGQTLVFASELKAITAFPNFQPQIDRDSLTLFLRYNYVPVPYSIYQGIYKLPSGCLLTWNGITPHPDPIPYWSARTIAEEGIVNPFTGSDREVVEQLETLLKDAVQLRMVADVPLGVFLSGGLDSTTVVSLMQAQSIQPVKTFTIGFNEQGYNEAEYALKIAQYLGTDHTELYVTPEEARDVIPKLPNLYDEPFSDPSQIPTFLVSQLARKYVTVALSGDGGDELFAGYNRYYQGRNIWQTIGWIPARLRQIGAQALSSSIPLAKNISSSNLSSLLPAKLKQFISGNDLSKLIEVLTVPNAENIYNRLVSNWKEPESIVLGGTELPTVLSDRERWPQLPDFVQRMMYLDLVSYLPDDILVKLDRASMGVSLEGRIPMLDHRLVEFAWRVPLTMKIRYGQGKWLLRQVLYKYLPSSLVERPKMGFNVPIDSWLRNDLRDWAESLLDESRLRQEGFFNPKPIRQKWIEHLAGKQDWQYYLWNILMFQSWLEKNM